jgi:hypothetical protein
VMRWNYAGERSHLGLTYAPNYTTYVRNRDYNTWNHELNFTADRQLTQKWSIGTGANGMYSNMDQILFTPSTLATVTALPAQFEDFANTLLQRPMTVEQVASAISGASVVDTPSRVLFFGNRVFSSGGNVALSYAHSSRTTISGAVSALHMQPVSTDERGFLDDRTTPLLANTTSGNASLSVSHGLSPRTQIGVSAGGDRTISSVQDAYRTSVTAFVGRRMGMHWFAQVHGGTGTIIAVRESTALPRGLQYLSGGSLGFATRSHTFLGSVSRNFGDQFGIGAGSTLDTAGSWHWTPAWRTWVVFAGASTQRLQGVERRTINTWQANAGVTKAWNRHLSATVEYAYLTYDARSELFRRIGQNVVRGSITWTPQPTTRRSER